MHLRPVRAVVCRHVHPAAGHPGHPSQISVPDRRRRPGLGRGLAAHLVLVRPWRPRGRVRALAAEVVLEADDVVELGGRDLDELAAARSPRSGGCGPTGTCAPSPGPSSSPARSPSSSSRSEQQPAGQHVDRLVLDLVVLERQPPAGLDDQDLADVAVRVRPRSARGPRACRPAAADRASAVAAHEPRTSRSPAAEHRVARRLATSPRCRPGRAAPCREVRTSSHEPSATKNLKPSFVSSGMRPRDRLAGELGRGAARAARRAAGP